MITLVDSHLRQILTFVHQIVGNNQGDVVSQEAGLSTPAEEYSSVFSQMPLTKESLHMKDLGEALDGANKDDGYFSAHPLSVPETSGKSSLGVWSNASTCGSNIATPVVPSTARSSPQMPAVPTAVGTSPIGESLIPGDHCRLGSLQ